MKSPVTTPQRPRFFTGNFPLSALLLLAVMQGSGCALLHRTTAADKPSSGNRPPEVVAGTASSTTRPQPAVSTKKGLLPCFPSIPNPFANLHPFRRTPPPPKAQAPIRVGIIRTLSNDGNYVIVELEPGMLVAPGRNLFVTGAGGEPVHLRAAEVHPPYFVADILGGHPALGSVVQE